VVPLILGLARAGHERNHPRQIGAGREGFVARTGNNRGAYIVILGDALPCFSQAHDDLRVHRGVDLGTIDREVCDVIADVEK
jgi:hypothetical protein